MSSWNSVQRLVAAAVLLLIAEGRRAAAEIRFHYVPVDAAGNTTMQPAGGGSVGERSRWFGTVREPFSNQPRPNYLLTYQHYYTGRPVTVPLFLPWGTPRIEHVRDRIVYNYGSFTTQVQFLPDGSLDVIYNNGFLRAL